jgi:uncharacterized membrane protein YeaQ/YmgE (transglycosylase-associated protein family)
MGVFSILSWILFGLIVGALARLLMPGRQAMGCFMTILLGIVGSFAGGALSWLIFRGDDGFFRPSGWIMSIIGGLIVLGIYGAIAAKPNSHRDEP